MRFISAEYRIFNLSIGNAGINCWNPAFDVTPHDFISGGIITEHGVFEANMLKPLKNLL